MQLAPLHHGAAAHCRAAHDFAVECAADAGPAADVVGLAARRGLNQSDRISHIDMQDDHIDTVISHINSPYLIPTIPR